MTSMQATNSVANPRKAAKATAIANVAGSGAAERKKNVAVAARSMSEVKCRNCDKMGHYAKNCPSDKREPTCYNCHKPGHIAKECAEERAVKGPKGSRQRAEQRKSQASEATAAVSNTQQAPAVQVEEVVVDAADVRADVAAQQQAPDPGVIDPAAQLPPPDVYVPVDNEPNDGGFVRDNFVTTFDMFERDMQHLIIKQVSTSDEDEFAFWEKCVFYGFISIWVAVMLCIEHWVPDAYREKCEIAMALGAAFFAIICLIRVVFWWWFLTDYEMYTLIGDHRVNVTRSGADMRHRTFATSPTDAEDYIPLLRYLRYRHTYRQGTTLMVRERLVSHELLVELSSPRNKSRYCTEDAMKTVFADSMSYSRTLGHLNLDRDLEAMHNVVFNTCALFALRMKVQLGKRVPSNSMSP